MELDRRGEGTLEVEGGQGTLEVEIPQRSAVALEVEIPQRSEVAP